MTENQKEILVIVLAFLFIFGGMMFITGCKHPSWKNDAVRTTVCFEFEGQPVCGFITYGEQTYYIDVTGVRK